MWIVSTRVFIYKLESVYISKILETGFYFSVGRMTGYGKQESACALGQVRTFGQCLCAKKGCAMKRINLIQFSSLVCSEEDAISSTSWALSSVGAVVVPGDA